MLQIVCDFGAAGSYADQRSSRRLFRRKGNLRSGCDRVKFARHQHREVAGMMDAASELAHPVSL